MAIILAGASCLWHQLCAVYCVVIERRSPSYSFQHLACTTVLAGSSAHGNASEIRLTETDSVIHEQARLHRKERLGTARSKTPGQEQAAR
mmetsp:Transcript_9681/g.22031  ORF Transcript_9681/g.22031 Transcript_9681/m.22031 type:complete len:90 (+) Transcript_9681:98-367(+)